MVDLLAHFDLDPSPTLLQNLAAQTKQLLEHNKNITFASTITQQSLTGIATLCRDGQLDLICKFEFDLSLSCVCFSISLFQESQMYCLSCKSHRLLALRLSLLQNQNTELKLKINPTNGEVRFEHAVALARDVLEFSREFPEFIADVINKSRLKAREVKIKLEEYLALEKYAHDKKYLPELAVEAELEKQTKYVVNSARFWWGMMTNFRKQDGTKNFKISPVPGPKKPIVAALYFEKNNMDINKFQPDKEDQKIINEFVKKSKELGRTKSDILKKITGKVNLQTKRQVAPGMFFASVQSSGNNVEMFFEKLQDKALLERQTNILKKISQYEPIKGQVIYYSLQKQPQFDEYRITNLTDFDTYLNFLNKSQQTLSPPTKLYLLKQILDTMIILRERGVLLHQITPSTIRIQRKLEIKLYDFTRAVHQELSKIEQPEKGNLYLLNTSSGDEREDVFSFGALMYRTFFGVAPLYLRRVPRKVFVPNFQSSIVLATEKFMQHGPKHLARLIGHLSLKCMDIYEKPKQSSWSFDKAPTLQGLDLAITSFSKYVSQP